MVPVGVEEGEGSEIDPATDARDAVSPTDTAWLIGGVAEPKSAFVKRREATFTPENCAGFAFFIAVIAAN